MKKKKKRLVNFSSHGAPSSEPNAEIYYQKFNFTGKINLGSRRRCVRHTPYRTKVCFEHTLALDTYMLPNTPSSFFTL